MSGMNAAWSSLAAHKVMCFVATGCTLAPLSLVIFVTCWRIRSRCSSLRFSPWPGTIAGRPFRPCRLRLLGLGAGSGSLLDGVDLLRGEPQPPELFLDARRDGKTDSLLRGLIDDLGERHVLLPHAGDLAQGERFLVGMGRQGKVPRGRSQQDRPNCIA